MSIRWGHVAGAATVVFASALVWRPSSAQTNGTPIRLEYDAAGSCPSRDTFVGALRARTGGFELTLADPRATTFRVTLRSGDESTGRVESREASGAPIVQELRGTTCGEVADALALVVALALDPRAADAAAPPPSLAPSPASAPRELPFDRPVGLTPRASRWAISSTVGFGVTGLLRRPRGVARSSSRPRGRRPRSLAPVRRASWHLVHLVEDWRFLWRRGSVHAHCGSAGPLPPSPCVGATGGICVRAGRGRRARSLRGLATDDTSVVRRRRSRRRALDVVGSRLRSTGRGRRRPLPARPVPPRRIRRVRGLPG